MLIQRNPLFIKFHIELTFWYDCMQSKWHTKWYNLLWKVSLHWTKHHWNRWKSIAISRLTSFLMEFLGRNKACLHNDLYLNKNWYIRFRLKIILHLFQPHTPFHYILVWETILAAYKHLKTIDLYFFVNFAKSRKGFLLSFVAINPKNRITLMVSKICWINSLQFV